MRTLISVAAALCGGTCSAEPPQPPMTYTVSFNQTPWPEVLMWFAKKTDLKPVKPPKSIKGSATIKSGEGVSFEEIHDLLNEALEPSGHTLVRGPELAFFHHFEQPLPEDIARVTAKELPNRAKSELVQVVLTFDAHDAEIVDERSVKKLLSRFGKLEFSANQLVVTDKAHNIRNILGYSKPILKPLPDPTHLPPVPTTPLVLVCPPQTMIGPCPPLTSRRLFRCRR